MNKRNKLSDYGTYESGDAWVTPLGGHRIVHYDCPTKEEIKQRVTEAINELVFDEGFEPDCPLCALMKEQAYDIVYYCMVACCKCKKAKICKNFDPKSI
jgi:hypothetical protein